MRPLLPCSSMAVHHFSSFCSTTTKISFFLKLRSSASCRTSKLLLEMPTNTDKSLLAFFLTPTSNLKRSYTVFQDTLKLTCCTLHWDRLLKFLFFVSFDIFSKISWLLPLELTNHTLVKWTERCTVAICQSQIAKSLLMHSFFQTRKANKQTETNIVWDNGSLRCASCLRQKWLELTGVQDS